MRNAVVIFGCILVAACSAPPTAATTNHKPKAETSSPGGPTDSTDPPTPDPASPGAQDAGPRPGIGAFPGSRIFMPPKTPAPGVVMLHGSEGGSEVFIEQFATEIAKQGFVVVTFCWFGCTGRPDDRPIPLESVVDVGQWLAGSPDVAKGKVGLFGWSRGAELSLLVTSLVGAAPFQAVAVHAPSDTVVLCIQSRDRERIRRTTAASLRRAPPGRSIPAPSSTWKGQPLFGEPKAD